jgi:hypothetical protein
MVKVKVIHTAHVSESHAVSNFEELVNSYIQKDILSTNHCFKEIQVTSTTVNNKLCIIGIITYVKNKIYQDDNQILETLSCSIKRKEHFLLSVHKGGGAEDAFYGDLIDLGFNRNPPRTSPDFIEFEFKVITANDLENTIEKGFTQHNEKVVTVIAATEENTQALETMKKKFKIITGDTIIFSEKGKFSNKWMPAIFTK